MTALSVEKGDLILGEVYGSGTVVLHEGVKMLRVPLWRSYFAALMLAQIARGHNFCYPRSA